MLPRRVPIPPGREVLVDTLSNRLRSGESVLLTGPMGVGKTTIARAVASRTAAEWVSGRPVDALLDLVGGDGGPLVLDGLDALDDDALETVLLAATRPCLLTRRAHGEPGGLVPDAVAPLALSGVGAATAEGLFDRTLARLTAGMPIEAPDDDIRTLLLAVSDGLPAVIEALADAWWLHGSALADRLRPLLGGERAAEADPTGLPVERLADAFDALDAEEARALAALSIAPGAFDLAGATVLIGDRAPVHLRALVRRGLLRVAAPGRFRLYGVVRAAALTRDGWATHRAEADLRYASWIVETGDGFADAGRLPERPHPAVDLPTVYAVMEHAWSIDDVELADRASTLLMYWWDDPVPPWDPAAHAASRTGETARARFFRAIDAESAGRRERAFGEMKAALALAGNPWVRVVALNWLGSHLAFEPSMRAQRAARAFYEEATAVCRTLGVRWKEAHCLSCRAGLLQAGGELEAALDLYTPVLEIQAERPTWCHWAYNLVDRARLLAELGRFDEARHDSDRAIAAHEANGYPEYAAIAHADRALVEHLAGDLAAAEHHLERAMSRIATGPIERELLARITARMAAVRAAQGHRSAAERLMTEARRVLEDRALSGRLPTLGWERALTRAVMPLYAALVDEAAGPEAIAVACHAPDDDDRLPLVRRLDEARILVTLLRQHDTGGLRVAPDGSAFRIDDDPPVSTSRFRAARALLVALAELRVDAPGQGVSTEALFGAGWPGVDIDPISARNRVYAELSRLRKLGLDGWIERADEGYRLMPGRPVAIEDVPGGG